MNHNKNCERLIDYYNGQLKDKDKQAFEKHLAECPDCQAELAEWEILNAEMVKDIEQISPPSDMEDRILTNIFAEDTSINTSDHLSDEKFTKNANIKTKNKSHKSSSFYKIMVLPLAAALLLSVIGNVYLWASQQQPEPLSEALLQDDEAINLTPTSDTLDMDAKMAMHETNGTQTVMIEGENFTPLNEGEVYQVWLMENEQPYRAGTFVPNEHGDGYTVFTLEDTENVDWDAAAITVEPSPQNQTPEGDILMLAEF